uniref:Uncharacterized protein n=1 Tax=Anguilla anguilla TaxID=7936 RepID=A0A0E9T2S6_ANGAN
MNLGLKTTSEEGKQFPRKTLCTRVKSSCSQVGRFCLFTCRG